MGYLLANTSPDDLLLMIAAEDGGKIPEFRNICTCVRSGNRHDDKCAMRGLPSYMTEEPPRTYARGFCHLNYTDNLHSLYPKYIRQSQYQGFVVHLTWEGWERVETLLADGHKLPTEEERSKYASYAMRVVEGGKSGDYIPLDVPNPRGIEPDPPVQRDPDNGVFGWFVRHVLRLPNGS